MAQKTLKVVVNAAGEAVRRTSKGMAHRELKPHFKVWLVKRGKYAFGGGLAAILAAIRETGSIKAASVLLKESYRYVWGRIQKSEAVLGIKLIETTVGGRVRQRAQLTAFARRLLEPYLRFEQTARQQMDRAFARMFKEINHRSRIKMPG